MSDLRTLRAERGLSQSELAGQAGLSRQGYAAIESGKARPSVDVAMRLARALGTSVEALFRLPETSSETVSAKLVGRTPRSWPVPVRLAEVAGRTLAFAARHARGLGLGLADGLAAPEAGDRVRVSLFASRPKPPQLVVIGCDPAFALVADLLRRERGIEVLWLQAGSRAALEALARGEAHVAGVHVRDEKTGVYNAPLVERLLPGAASVVHFATWEQTLMVPDGNPLGVSGPADLARPEVRFVNREAGSGSRSLIDRWLAEGGVAGPDIVGYETTCAAGHLEVAAAVAAGTADAGVGIRAAGILFGLDARVIASEPYDLVFPFPALELPAVQALLDVLREPGLHRQVEALGGYDASAMGRPG